MEGRKVFTEQAAGTAEPESLLLLPLFFFFCF